MSMNMQCLFFISLFVFGFSRYLSDFSTNHSNTVQEIQHAVCKIATKDIQASANATITRQLKGVCTSKELNHRFDQLEKKLFHEINIIKNTLNIEHGPVPENEDNIHLKALENAAHTYNSHDYDYFNTIESVKTEETFNPQTVTYHLLQAAKNTTTNNNFTSTEEKTTTTEKSVTATTSSNIAKNLENSYKRDFEAAKHNVTIQNTELGKSFLYFWKIYDIGEILTYSDTHIDSPIFYLLGHPLQIRFYPHHQGTHYVAVELSNTDSFIFKHRFTILNQNNEQGDLTSQILGINAAFFRISSQKLSDGGFTIDGSLIVKVAIALRAL